MHGHGTIAGGLDASPWASVAGPAEEGGPNSSGGARGATWRRATGDLRSRRKQVAPEEAEQEQEQEEEEEEADFSDCILLFGAFGNGNMGDVVQPISMEHLLSSVAPSDQCFYYAHPIAESPDMGFRIGEFFGGDESKLIGLSSDLTWKVNKFKAFVIGGGGIFADKHGPLYVDSFVDDLTLPVVVLGVGSNYHAKEYRNLLQKAAFVSGRDTSSVLRFADILMTADTTPAVKPDDVQLVRDPVLSDKELTDTTGSCWRQSEGDHHQPLCFVLPAAKTDISIRNHEHLRAKVVRPGDRLINVFPKHQSEIEQFGYPETVQEILDPMEYVKELCSCKAIISTRFHGVILGLHMGVPTFGLLHLSSKNKVPDLMIDTLSLPDQFFLIDEHLTREVVDQQVDAVRRSYENEGRRGAIHARLSAFHQEFQTTARHVMSNVLNIIHLQPEQQGSAAQPRVAFGDNAWQPLRPTLPSSPLTPAATGQDSIVAVFLLFAIAGLALLPSVAGGKDLRSHHEPSKEPAVNGDHERLSSNGRRANGGHSSVQKEVDARNSTSAERGFLRSATTAFETSSLGRFLLGCRCAQSAFKPSNLLFALNFVLWIALAVTFSSYSKSYLRDTHDPVGLLALQGVSGSVVLFLLGRLGLGAPDASNPSDAPSKTRGVSGLQTQLITASRRETLAAVLHSGQAVLTNFSLFVGGVAVTNALKAMEPVAAAVASYFLLGKRVAPEGMAALAIIVAGITLLTFKGTGGGGHTDAGEAPDAGGGGHHITGGILVSAAFTMAAVSCNALRNVVIKKGDPIPPQRTLFTCSVVAGMFGVTLMLLRLMFRGMDELLIDGEAREANGREGASQYGSWLSMDGINAALCFVGYNFASFNLLARLSPVGHAVGNSVKRVVMFGSGIVLMGEVMAARQLAGAAVALAGVGVYNVASKRK